MKAGIELCARGARAALAVVFSFLLWTAWLGLVVLIFFQLYIATANELAIPDFALRRLENKLEESGIRASFGRTSFDPAGRVLIENVRLSLPAFAEPIVISRAMYVRLNLWMLMMGRIEAREIRLTDVTAFVPAMLSPSGRTEAILRKLDATIVPERRAVTIHQLSAMVAGVPVSARGTLRLDPRARRKSPLDNLATFVAQQFPQLCRRTLALSEHLARLEDPALHLELSPSESGAATIEVLALARSARLTQPMAIEAVGLRASTRLLLFGDAPPSNVDFSAADVRLADHTHITGLHADVIGRLRLAGVEFELREVAATADEVTHADVDVRAVAARIFPRPLPRIEAHVTASILGAPLAARADADLTLHQARVQFEGAISPRVMDVVNRRFAVNVRKHVDFESLTAERAEAHFGPDWKFERLNARIRLPRIAARGVTLHDARAEIELDRHRFHSPDAFARLGDNFARGSYEHDLKTNQFRFLLAGRLRPLDISGWFREWWANFFQQFEFPAAPPAASVDVRGLWREGHRTSVFVFADVPRMNVRDSELDRVRTRMFIRPAFFDGLELLAMRGKGRAQGRFTYIVDPHTRAWQTLDVALDSTLDLNVAAQLLGPLGAKTLAPFHLAQPPELELRGRFAGPAAPEGAGQQLRIQARTAGEFRFHDFPLHDVSFIATIDRDNIVLDGIEALFAGGKASGHARVWGEEDQRRLGFDFSLENASLGRVAAGLNEFFAARKNEAPAPPGKFVQEKADVQLNLAASAEGRYNDAMSYRGDGHAVLHGAEIGEVPLLGTLSELLKFTALRFTEAHANFKIENARLNFTEVTLRGPDSAIDAHGTYALDSRELDFNARIFPFQESGNLIKTVVGAVLTPLSNAFEVNLTGTLADPEWAFVIGPTNFLRSLGASPDAKAKPSAAITVPTTPRRPGDEQ